MPSRISEAWLKSGLLVGHVTLTVTVLVLTIPFSDASTFMLGEPADMTRADEKKAVEGVESHLMRTSLGTSSAG